MRKRERRSEDGKEASRLETIETMMLARQTKITGKNKF